MSHETEHLEHDLAVAAPTVRAAAGELAEAGHLEAAEILRTVADVEDLHEMSAEVLVRCEAAEKGERDLALYALYDSARALKACGDPKYEDALVTLCELIEQLGAVFGLPDEDMAA